MQLNDLLNPRLKIGIGVMATITLFGTLGFMLIEGWPVIDALYTTMLVISTLGYADLRPSGVAGKLLTIVLITSGVGTLYYLVGALAQNLIETQLDRGKRRSMDQQINRLTNHFIVCGFGRVGQETCQQLRNQGHLFVVVDSGHERSERIRSRGYLCVEGDASDDLVLKQAGVLRARALLTAVQSDAGNVYITLSARALNPKLFIVARAATTEAEHKLSIAGANRVMSPYVMGGRGMAGMALRPAVMELMDLLIHGDELGVWLEERPVVSGSPMEGQCLNDLAVRELRNLMVLAVRRAGGQIQPNPPPDTVLHAGDVLVVLVKR
jgi:voltage-gated potassium channel